MPTPASLNNPASVSEQYRTEKNLNARISLHQKYSTNPQPFREWILAQYAFAPHQRVLELGCGTADVWKGSLAALGEGTRLTLTDLSEGMLAAARSNVGDAPNVDYRQVDIQRIPYEDGAFDVVIANMMLYHVPDLEQGLREVRRVLKPGGRFYCATNGENGIWSFVKQTFAAEGVPSASHYAFSLQNGEAILRRHFGVVELRTREDALVVTRLRDFVDYLRSMESISGTLSKLDDSALFAALEKQCVDGALHIPKEYGMFVCA